jgi:dihydroorotase
MSKSKGWQVTAEVSPHHLLLTDELVATFDPVYKVNPPLRTAADVAALRAGLADGDPLPEAGTDAAASLAVGAPATLALLDPTTRWTVEPHALASRSRNTPYGDRTLPGRVRATFLRGRPTVLDGKIA